MHEHTLADYLQAALQEINITRYLEEVELANQRRRKVARNELMSDNDEQKEGEAGYEADNEDKASLDEAAESDLSYSDSEILEMTSDEDVLSEPEVRSELLLLLREAKCA